MTDDAWPRPRFGHNDDTTWCLTGASQRVHGDTGGTNQEGKLFKFNERYSGWNGRGDITGVGRRGAAAGKVSKHVTKLPLNDDGT